MNYYTIMDYRRANWFLRVLKNPWILLFIIILFGFWFRFTNAIFSPVTYPDSVQYMSLAEDIRSGIIFSNDYNLDESFLSSRRLPPFYPLLLAVLSFLPVELEILGTWISLILNLLCIVLLFLIGRKLESDAAGIIAAVIFSFHWFVLEYATPVLTESTFTFLYLCIITLSFWGFSQHSKVIFVFLGIMCSLCFLTREVGITSIFIVILAYLIWLKMKKNLTIKGNTKIIGIMMISFILTSFPYWFHIRVHTGEWALTSRMNQRKIVNAAKNFSPTRFRPDIITKEEIGKGDDKNEIKEEKKEDYLKKIPILFKYYFLKFTQKMGLPLTINFILGFIHLFIISIKTKNWMKLFKELYLLVWIFQLIGIYSVFSGCMDDARYIYPIIPLGILMAALEIDRIGKSISKYLSRKRAVINRHETVIRGVVTVIILIIIIMGLSNEYKKFHIKMSRFGIANMFAAGHKEAASEILSRGLIPQGKVVMDRKPFLAYYVKGKFKKIPKTYSDLLRTIEKGKIDYIVADSLVLGALRPLLEPLAFGFEPDIEPEIIFVNENQYYIDSNEVSYTLPLNTKIIYSRYFQKYRRIITVYKVKVEEKESNNVEGISLKELLYLAQKNMANGYYYDALKEYEVALKKDPKCEEAYKNQYIIYQKYYKMFHRPYILKLVKKTSHAWLYNMPESKMARKAHSYLLKGYTDL